jgi:2-dehydro-3-deoxygluconokinase
VTDAIRASGPLGGPGHDGAGPAPVVVTLGESMGLLSSVTPGPLAHASTLQLGMGGSESNVAIGVSRLGVRAVWCGRVGDDAVGRLVAREIRAEGVDVRVVVDAGAPTGLMLKERRTSTSQSVSYYRTGSAGSRLRADDVDAGLVEAATVLHVTGITPALSESAAHAVRSVVDRARAAGVVVSFDVNYRSALWSEAEASRVCRDIVARCDVVFAGEDEAAMLVGPAGEAGDEEAAAVELARRLTALGPSQAVVKRGASGAVAVVDGAVLQRPGIPLVAHDTVGAGDAFVAGWLAETALGRDPERRMTTAVAAGAFACLAAGDWEGLPRRAELALLEERDPVRR